MNLGNQIRHDLDLGKLFFAVEDFAATGFELHEKFVEIQVEILWPVVFQIAAAAMVEFFRAADVAIAEMMQADGDLNQALIEAAWRSLSIGPEFFPNFVGLEKITLVKVFDALQVTWIVGTLGHWPASFWRQLCFRLIQRLLNL